MDKYILIGSVSGIGGWQLYTEARAEYLTQNGIETFIISEFNPDSPIKLKGFEKQKIIFCDELFRPIYIYSTKQIERTVEYIISKISYEPSDKIYIEATNIATTLWGEIFAKRTNGVCCSYILQSHIYNISQQEQVFLKHKYDDNSLFGMSKLTIPDIFKGYLDVKDDVRELLASWKPPISDEKEIIEDLDTIKDDIIVIGYFGNLNKPHFLKLCEFLRQYVHKHSDKRFAFLSIGSSADGLPELEQKKLSTCVDNCLCINIPSLYPVPKTYFDYMDVCLGSWGSSTTAAKAGAISIRLVDDVDIIPHGIIGITLLKKPYYENPRCKESLEELLDKILFEKKYKGVVPSLEENKNDNNAMQKHIQVTLMNSMNNSKREYYDISQIRPYGWKNIGLMLSNRIIGVNLTKRIVKLLKDRKTKK